MDSDSTNDNPFATPAAESEMVPPAAAMSSATRKSMQSVRAVLLLVGIISIGFYIFSIVNAPEEVSQVLQQDDAGELAVGSETLVLMVRIVYGLGILLGISYLVLGGLVLRFPLFCSAVGLTLYIGATALNGMMEPTSLLRGIILKVIVVVVLYKGVMAGLAHRREQREAYDRMFGMDNQMAPQQ